MHWIRVSRGLAGGSWSEFCAKVAALRPGRLWRYAQAGDLPGYGPQIDGKLLEELIAANSGKTVIAFTHKPVLDDNPVAIENRRLITAALEAGFTINLSSDNAAHADKLAELGIAPVVTVLARDYARRAVRHRFKRRRDEWAETVGEWRGSNCIVAAAYACRKTNSGLPGDVFRRDLQDLRRLCTGSRCRGSRCRRGNSSLTPSPSRSAGLEGRGVRNYSEFQQSQYPARLRAWRDFAFRPELF
jgi:hypothetical protein